MVFFKNLFDLTLFEEYLEEKTTISQSTIAMYSVVVGKFLKEHKNIDSIESYNKFIIDHSIKKRNTIAYSALKNFINFHIKDTSLKYRLKEELIRPEVHKNTKRERKYLEEDQIISIINGLKQKKHKIIALIQDLTGVRSGDVFNLKRGNIVPEIYEDSNVLKLIIEGKGKKRNVVFIHDPIIQKLIMDYIIFHRSNTDYYFLEDKSRNKSIRFKDYRLRKNNYKRYSRDMKQSMYKLGIDFKDFATHDYRRCFARRVWTRYKDVAILQDLLNHANPATTMLYLKQSGLKNIDYHKEMQTK